MLKVLKFPLNGGFNEVHLEGKANGRPEFDFQRGDLMVWIPVAGHLPASKLLLYVGVTGEDVPEGYDAEYLGKAGKGDNDFVVHLFSLDKK